MNQLIPVEANPHLARDASSQAVLNLDRAGYTAFVEQKRRRQSKEQELQDQLNTLKTDLDQMKRVLQQLLEAK